MKGLGFEVCHGFRSSASLGRGLGFPEAVSPGADEVVISAEGSGSREEQKPSVSCGCPGRRPPPVIVWPVTVTAVLQRPRESSKGLWLCC